MTLPSSSTSNLPARPASSRPGWRRVWPVLGLLVFFAGGYQTARLQKAPPVLHLQERSPARVPLQGGPWGELEYVPFTISAPSDLLPVHGMENEKVVWYFGGYSSATLATFVHSLHLAPELEADLLRPENQETVSGSVQLSPSPEALLALPEAARARIFQQLAPFRENDPFLTIVAEATVDERFAEAGVSPESRARFRRLSCRSGSYLVFCGFRPLLAGLPSYEEKLRLLQALTRQKSLLLRLHVTPESDVASLATYWGKGCWNTDVQAMLGSLAHVPGGTWLDIIELLPPFPTSLLYTFPVPQNPLQGPTQVRDCHWTSFNFFRDVPDPKASSAEYYLAKLKTDYFPVQVDPRYGDLVLFNKPNGDTIHSAIYLADEIVYTKNGENAVHPWVLSTMKEVLEQYNFALGSEEKLQVRYFRPKYY